MSLRLRLALAAFLAAMLYQASDFRARLGLRYFFRAVHDAFVFALIVWLLVG